MFVPHGQSLAFNKFWRNPPTARYNHDLIDSDYLIGELIDRDQGDVFIGDQPHRGEPSERLTASPPNSIDLAHPPKPGQLIAR
ncbi:MAG: hypothetical protein LBT86_09425 [Deltaproteobacteria bacterium]|nr:hypothetical protein [Deltaproteobacteria bacterium]